MVLVTFLFLFSTSEPTFSKIQHFRTTAIEVNSLRYHALCLDNKLKSKTKPIRYYNKRPLQQFWLTLLFKMADLRIIILARSSYRCAISMAFSNVTLLWSVSCAKSTWNVRISVASMAYSFAMRCSIDSWNSLGGQYQQEQKSFSKVSSFLQPPHAFFKSCF